MELKSLEVLKVLKEKGVEAFYHANTVHTCGTFFRDGHLLSRGSVHERGLDQTDQISDALDRRLGIWYDIFFDTVDIHKQASNIIHYGPVLMCFSLSILEQDWAPKVWVAKSNPIDWERKNISDEDRWYRSIEELEANFSKTNFGNHIVFRNIGGTIRLLPYLKYFTIDKPQRAIVSGGIHIDVISSTMGALLSAGRVSKILSKGIHVFVRDCPSYCSCQNSYKAMTNERFEKFFKP